MSDKLLPCPFCGGTPKLRTHRSGEDSMEAYVECPTCEVRTTYYEDAYAPVDDAIGAWNRRAAPPQTNLRGPEFGPHGSATAMFDVIAERLRQQEQEGWTTEHDDEHTGGELAQAAACYTHASYLGNDLRYQAFWPWDAAWWKPWDRRRNLVKAGALIIAEIERLDRAALATTEGSDAG